MNIVVTRKINADGTLTLLGPTDLSKPLGECTGLDVILTGLTLGQQVLGELNARLGTSYVPYAAHELLIVTFDRRSLDVSVQRGATTPATLHALLLNQIDSISAALRLL